MPYYPPSGGGVTDHGALTGLADDDHTQYALDTDLTTHAGAADPHTGYQKESEKSQASGYASLDSGTHVPTAELGSGSASSSTYLRGDQSWAAITDTSGGLLPYGSGFDGDVTIASGTTTLTRDMAYNNLTIQAGGNLVTAGFRVQVKGTLSVAATGSINNDGGNASVNVGGTAAGAGGASGLGSGAAGVNGSTAAGNTGGTLNSSLGGNGGIGGTGNNGANAAGAAGTANHNLTGGDGQFDSYIAGWPCRVIGSTTQNNPGGAAGGSGGGDGTAGGGSGAGGGAMALAAKTISNSGRISCNGGNGGTPAGGNRGAGGGGGGGYLFIVYDTLTGNAPTVAGGSPGTKTGTGGAAAAGSTGRLIQIVNKA